MKELNEVKVITDETVSYSSLERYAKTQGIV